MPNNNFLQKSTQSKSCRELLRFSIERRAGRGCSGGCRAEGVIVSEKHSSSSFVMGFSADPASSQRKEEVVDWLSHKS